MLRAFIILLNVVFAPKFAHAVDLQNPVWMSEVLSQQVGSCETSNLNFSALRFNKIDLHKKIDGKDVFLRVILFLRADGVVSVRLNEQALLGCVVNSAGEELCSYKSVTDQWFSSVWSSVSDSVEVDHVGVISKMNAVPYRNYVMKFSDQFRYGDFSGQNFTGAVVLVNFDNTGKSVSRICP